MKSTLPVDNLGYSIFLNIDQGKSTGSGFRFKYKEKNYVITAKHVLFNDNGELRGEILTVTSQSPDKGITEPNIFEVALERAMIHSSKKSDVAAILIGKNIKLQKDDIALKDIKVTPIRPTKLAGENYLRSVSLGIGSFISADIEVTRGISEIRIANDVYLMGYPTSLGLQRNSYFDYSKPLIRKGIIAGINSEQNTFTIDCASYQGNSGGPIIEHCEDNYYRLIGFVSKSIPYETTWHSNRDQIKNTEISNSGYSVCVPIDEVIDLLNNSQI